MKKKVLYICCCILVLATITGCFGKKKDRTNVSQDVGTAYPASGERTRKSIFPDNVFQEVPDRYFKKQKQRGDVVRFSYDAKNYAGNGETYKKSALVYLPYGYDAQDEDTKYNILYLMHGGGDDENWYLVDEHVQSGLQMLLDSMIAEGTIEPCIVCTPTFNNSYCDNASECTEFFSEELTRDLIPALEGEYNTYYNSGKKNSMEETRMHRAFGGFSMGAATTWWVFEKCLKEVGYFLPISGDSWCVAMGGGSSKSQETAKELADSVSEQGMTSDDFYIYSGSGGKDDMASAGMKSQVEAMKQLDQTFTFCNNFADGNLYYYRWKKGNHDINTVYNMVYNGLPKFFDNAQPCTTRGKENTANTCYENWAKTQVVDKIKESSVKKVSGREYGSLKKYQYYSSTAQRKTKVNILLPPGYSEDKKYPVLYLLHGYWDNEDWMAGDSVSLQNMLGNLYAEGKARKMIVVMPYIFCSKEQKECTGMDLKNTLCYDNFVNDLITDLMPFMENTFSVATGRDNTAITGFSMGGREALFIGITHSELFGYVGAVCPAPGLTPGTDRNMHPGQLKEEELKFDTEKGVPYFLLLSAAQEDPAVGDYPNTIQKLLSKNGVKNIWNSLPDGGHDASSVKVHLYNYLRMIFRSEEFAG